MNATHRLPDAPAQRPDAAALLSRVSATAIARRVAAPPAVASAWRDIATAARTLADVGRVELSGFAQYAGGDSEAAGACCVALGLAELQWAGALSSEREAMASASLALANAGWDALRRIAAGRS